MAAFPAGVHTPIASFSFDTRDVGKRLLLRGVRHRYSDATLVTQTYVATLAMGPLAGRDAPRNPDRQLLDRGRDLSLRSLTSSRFALTGLSGGLAAFPRHLKGLQNHTHGGRIKQVLL